jgi:hypothetical protein
MSIRYRLAFYLFGMFLGIIFLYYFLTGKAESRNVAFCYLPNCRVLKELRSKPFFYSEQSSEQLVQNGLDSLDIKELLQEGDVDFSKSDTKTKGPRTYFVNGQSKDNKTDVTLVLKNYREKVVLNEVQVNPN